MNTLGSERQEKAKIWYDAAQYFLQKIYTEITSNLREAYFHLKWFDRAVKKASEQGLPEQSLSMLHLPSGQALSAKELNEWRYKSLRAAAQCAFDEFFETLKIDPKEMRSRMKHLDAPTAATRLKKALRDDIRRFAAICSQKDEYGWSHLALTVQELRQFNVSGLKLLSAYRVNGDMVLDAIVERMNRHAENYIAEVYPLHKKSARQRREKFDTHQPVYRARHRDHLRYGLSLHIPNRRFMVRKLPGYAA